MNEVGASEAEDFAGHLRRLNGQRLEAASRYFAVVMAGLLVANVLVPAVHLWMQAAVQVIAIFYFCGLSAMLRRTRAERWPTGMAPVLFGVGVLVTGLAFSYNLTLRFGTNPAYSTLLFVACVGPIWPRSLLALVVVPAQIIHLAWVWDGGHSQNFALLMTFGAMATLVLGWFVAALQLRVERKAFEAAREMRRQKDALAAALGRVNALLDERREMVAVVAHDLQSPLAGIRALLRILEADPGRDHRRAMGEISRTCGEMHRLVTRLIEAHAGETLEQKLWVIEIAPILAEEIGAFTAMAAEKGIRVELEADPARAVAEPEKLSRAFGNLLSNAIKYSPAGSVVRVKIEQGAERVRVSVIDRGEGIPEGEKDLLFRKYSRLSTRPTGAEPASGLGLYIVRKLAEEMGATAGWEANLEGGSVFFIELVSGDSL